MRNATVQNYLALSRAAGNARVKSAAILPEVRPHECREVRRETFTRNGERITITYRN